MSANLYDESLLNKLKNWVKNKDPEIKITGPEETRRVFEYIADETNDKEIKLPLITLRRLPEMDILNTSKKPLSFDGWRKNNDGVKGDQVNAIPIGLHYQIDIYTRLYAEAEEYVREFIFNIINYPKLSITIPYNGANQNYISNIKLETPVNDNSDIPERLIVGQFTRKTIQINIDDGYLFDYRTKDTIKVEVETKTFLNDRKEE